MSTSEPVAAIALTGVNTTAAQSATTIVTTCLLVNLRCMPALHSDVREAA